MVGEAMIFSINRSLLFRDSFCAVVDVDVLGDGVACESMMLVACLLAFL